MLKFKTFHVFLLVIIVLTMYNNLEHSASVYYSISAQDGTNSPYQRFQSYLVVIVIDLAVIAFILHSNKKEAAVFAWILFLINALFFNILGSVHQIFLSEQTHQMIEESNKLIAKIAFSGLFSYSIHRFGYVWYELIQKQQEEKNAMDNDTKMDILKTVLQQEMQQKKEFEAQNVELKKMLDELGNDNAFLRNRLTRKKKENADKNQFLEE